MVHLPFVSGPNHNYRQHQLVTEGLLLPKTSALLGVGRRDMISSGSEDMFGSSDYTPNEPCKASASSLALIHDDDASNPNLYAAISYVNRR